jgi:hypothetical protein
MQKGYTDLWIKSDLPYIGSDYTNWYIYGGRLENDKEYRKRLKVEAIKATIEKQIEKQKIEHEKQELKRLMAKYPEESIARTNG